MKKLIHLLSSVRITVICLLLLFALTFWGTVAQVHQGLYVSQERFFNSFYFLAAGFIPFPGAQSVLWVLFINLVAASISHLSKLRHWRYIGIKLSHMGLLLYFAAAFITFHVSKESNLHLAEGEGSNLSASYQDWEIAFWKEEGNTRQVTAIDVKKSSQEPIFKNHQLTITVKQFYPNAQAFTKTLPASGVKPINASGITLLQPREIFKEREKNIAGGVFQIYLAQGPSSEVLLFAGESRPTVLTIAGQPVFFQLRHTRYPLPFTIKLDEFKVEFYPGTQMAKSYESYVSIIKPGVSRLVRIFMNNPLSEKDYTFYQASYDIDSMGRKYSTLAVVKNAGRILPYIACFAVFLGLVVHFLIMAFEKRLKK